MTPVHEAGHKAGHGTQPTRVAGEFTAVRLSAAGSPTMLFTNVHRGITRLAAVCVRAARTTAARTTAALLAAGRLPAGLRRLWSPVAIASALVLASAGCGAGSVEAPAPKPPAPVARLCGALRARLPHRLQGRPRRATTPRSPLVTAWGSPAIVVRCGVPRPSGLRPTSELADLDGISWLALPPGRPVTFTAVGRHAYVEVTVPPKYNPPGDVLLDLAAPIKATVPANADATL